MHVNVNISFPKHNFVDLLGSSENVHAIMAKGLANQLWPFTAWFDEGKLGEVVVN